MIVDPNFVVSDQWKLSIQDEVFYKIQIILKQYGSFLDNFAT